MTPPRNGKPTLIVADDDSAILVGLRTFLEKDFEVVSEVKRLSDLLGEVNRLNPDAVVLDISFRDEGDALDMVRIDRARGGFQCPFVVLSMYNDPNHIRAAFQAGASGYVGKGEDLGRLSEAVAAALRGERLLPEWMREQLGAGSPGGRKIRSDRVIVDGKALTINEIEVLLAAYEGMENSAIGRCLGMARSTVGSHLASLRRKLDVRERALLVRWAAERLIPLREAIRRK